MTLADKINALLIRHNEVAFGWDDCGCFWRFHYGPRGSGAMIDGIGHKFSSAPVDFEEAVDEFLAHLGIKL